MRKILATVCLVFVLCSVLVIPSAAYSATGEDATGVRRVHRLGWDTMHFMSYGEEFSFDHPYFDFRLTEGETALPGYQYYLNYPNTIGAESDSGTQIYLSGSVVDGGTNCLVSSEFSVYPFSTSTFFSFGFSGNTLIYDYFATLYNDYRSITSISLPPYVSLTYSVGFELLVPIRSVDAAGSVSWNYESVSLVYDQKTVSNSSSVPVSFRYLPSLEELFDASGTSAEVISAIRSGQVFLVSSSWLGKMRIPESMIAPELLMSHQVSSVPLSFDPGVYLPNALPRLKDYQVVNNDDSSNAGFTVWLGNVLRGMWEAPILPNITLGNIIAVCFTLVLVFVFYKLFGR